jgi:hypothetical protein
MPSIIPILPDIPFQELDVTLEGIVCRLSLQWNGREQAWYMDVSTVDDDLIVAGLKLVLGVYIGWRESDLRFPPGMFRMFDNSREGRDAGLNDLGVRVVMHYYAQEEFDV